MDEILNDRMNDRMNDNRWNMERIHSSVLFTLDILKCTFYLLLIWFFLAAIPNYQSQETGCITCDCKDDRSNDSETTIVKASCTAHDCEELYKQGHTCSGVYTIKPDKLPAFEVYCDMSNGGGWTVFQRRMDGSVDFYLKWVDYLKGFGDLNGEFWLGLDKIYRLTATGNTSLRVDLEDFEGVSVFAHYSRFIVGGAHTNYTITVGGYSGNAGDSLSVHDNMKFSTKDYDNDLSLNGNCAIAYKGAWWYTEGHLSNLNGLYLAGAHTSHANGVNWGGFKGHRYSLKVSEMKIRRN